MSDIPPKRPNLGNLHRRMMGDVQAFHSNVYAEAAQGNRIGATSASQFSQRLAIDRNRNHIRGYRDSMVSRSTDYRRSLSTDRTDKPATSMRPETPPSTGFKEPPTRNYNPYS